MRSTDDPLLVLEILRGDTARFAEVVERHDRAVRGVILLRVADPDTVEELVQQTFYLAFRRLAQLEEPQRLRGWLVRIAKSRVAEHYRKLARREREVEAEVTRVEAVAHQRSADWIWSEVERLPPVQSEVLQLRYRGELSYAEIAEELGVPVSTVRGRIYEARRALRRRLTA